jgi:hypothetical protein
MIAVMDKSSLSVLTLFSIFDTETELQANGVITKK